MLFVTCARHVVVLQQNVWWFLQHISGKACKAPALVVSHTLLPCGRLGHMAQHSCSTGQKKPIPNLLLGWVGLHRRIFPAVSGGVIEDIKFLGDERLLVAYYGGVTLFSTEAGASGMVLEYGVSRVG